VGGAVEWGVALVVPLYGEAHEQRDEADRRRRDLPAACAAATAEQCNALERLVLEAVEDGLLGGHENGAAWSAPSSEVLKGRKRRDSDSCLRHNGTSIVIAVAPERRHAGQFGREAYQTPRPRKLTPEQEDELRQMATGRTLRELAAHFGVSHEAIRKALHDDARAHSLPRDCNSATPARWLT
jgi:hypothetical protein